MTAAVPEPEVPESPLSDEAVEAGAKELAGIADPYGEWDKQAPSYRDLFRRKAKRVLEAARPHIENPAYQHGFDLAKDFYTPRQKEGA